MYLKLTRCCSRKQLQSSVYCLSCNSMATARCGTRKVSAIKPGLSTASRASCLKDFMTQTASRSLRDCEQKRMTMLHSPNSLCCCGGKHNGSRQKPINVLPFFQVNRDRLPYSVERMAVNLFRSFFKFVSFVFEFCKNMVRKFCYFQRWLRLLKQRELFSCKRKQIILTNAMFLNKTTSKQQSFGYTWI